MASTRTDDRVPEDELCLLDKCWNGAPADGRSTCGAWWMLRNFLHANVQAGMGSCFGFLFGRQIGFYSASESILLPGSPVIAFVTAKLHHLSDTGNVVVAADADASGEATDRPLVHFAVALVARWVRLLDALQAAATPARVSFRRATAGVAVSVRSRLFGFEEEWPFVENVGLPAFWSPYGTPSDAAETLHLRACVGASALHCALMTLCGESATTHAAGRRAVDGGRVCFHAREEPTGRSSLVVSWLPTRESGAREERFVIPLSAACWGPTATRVDVWREVAVVTPGYHARRILWTIDASETPSRRELRSRAETLLVLQMLRGELRVGLPSAHDALATVVVSNTEPVAW